MKSKEYSKAVEAYRSSLTEDRTAQTLELLKKAEKAQEEKIKNEYLSPEKSLEAKERGNEHFRNQKYPESIQEYSEAIKRNPGDHTLYSNRAASYTKLGEYMYALRDCDECIKINPNFAKVYSRKGTAHYFMKEYEKALEAYDKGMKLDPSNTEMEEGTQRVMEAMRKQRQSGNSEEARQQAMKNPEIIAILQFTRTLCCRSYGASNYVHLHGRPIGSRLQWKSLRLPFSRPRDKRSIQR